MYGLLEDLHAESGEIPAPTVIVRMEENKLLGEFIREKYFRINFS